MKIADSAVDAALAILKAKLNLSNCPACRADDWRIDQQFYSVLPYNPPNSATRQSGALPLALLFCGNCGLQMFFNAISIGLARPDGGPILAES